MPFTAPDHTPLQWHNAPVRDTPLDAAHLEAAEADIVEFAKASDEALATYAEGEFIHQDGGGFSTGIPITGATASALLMTDGAGHIASGPLASSLLSTGAANTFTATNKFTTSDGNVPLVVQNGVSATPFTQSTFFEIQGNITNPDANVRPSAQHAHFFAAPTVAPLVNTDFHGMDIQLSAQSGSNVNNFSRLYPVESAAVNNSTVQLSELSGLYGLASVGSGGAGGGAVSAWGVQSSMNMSNNAVVGEFDAFKVRPPFNQGGGGTITQAYGLRVQKWAASGMTYTNPPFAMYVDQGGGTLYTQQNLVVNNQYASDPVAQIAAAFTNDATKTSYVVQVNNNGTGAAVQINNAAGSAQALSILNSAAFQGINVTQGGASNAISTTQNGANDSLKVTMNAGATGFWGANIIGYSHGLSVSTSALSGVNGAALVVTYNKTDGAGKMCSLVNKGTGVYLDCNNGTTSLMQIDNSGNIVSNTTGIKIATATTQKLGFFNAAPVAQQSAVGAATGYSAGATVATFHSDDTYTGNTGSTAYTLNGIVAALKNLGLIAA